MLSHYCTDQQVAIMSQYSIQYVGDANESKHTYLKLENKNVNKAGFVERTPFVEVLWGQEYPLYVC